MDVMHFVISQGENGRFSWRLFNEHGQAVAQSVADFSYFDDCMAAIDAVRLTRVFTPIVVER
jgi:uncharacterized protein YegP (UPF0339 family)